MGRGQPRREVAAARAGVWRDLRSDWSTVALSDLV